MALTTDFPSAHLDHVETVKEYALVARGEHPGWQGDRVANAEYFGYRLGLLNDQAGELVRSVGIAETQYSLITGLPPGSLRRLTSEIKRGMRARLHADLRMKR